MAALLRIRRGRIGVLLGVVIGLAALSVVRMAMLVPRVGDPTRSFYGTDTRAQTLLFGSIAALVLHRWPLTGQARRRLTGLAAVSAIGVGLAFLVVKETARWMYFGGFAGFGLLATRVVVGAAETTSWSTRMLSLRPLTWLGTISYGIYLWHRPIHLWITPTRCHVPFEFVVALRATLSVMAAWVSFVLLERPIRRHLRRPLPSFAFAVVVVVGMLLSVVSAMGRTTVSDGRAGRAFGVGEPSAPRVEPVAYRFPAQPSGRPFRVTVLGDSVGWVLARAGVPTNVEVANSA